VWAYMVWICATNIPLNVFGIMMDGMHDTLT